MFPFHFSFQVNFAFILLVLLPHHRPRRERLAQLILDRHLRLEIRSKFRIKNHRDQPPEHRQQRWLPLRPLIRTRSSTSRLEAGCIPITSLPRMASTTTSEWVKKRQFEFSFSFKDKIFIHSFASDNSKVALFVGKLCYEISIHGVLFVRLSFLFA